MRLAIRLFATRAAGLGLLMLACLCLTSCGPAPEPLRVGAIAWPGYEPLFLAEAEGRLAAAHIQVVEQPAASDVLRLLRDRDLEAAYLTLDETLTLLAEGLDLQVILVADRSQGADAVLVRPPRDKLADLKGSRVGVENTAVGGIVLAAALDKAGLTPADLELQFIPVNRHAEAYKNGEVDALVTFEPIRSSLIAAGARQVFDSSLIPERIVDVMVVRREVADAREKQVRALVAAHFGGLALLREQPERAAAIISRRWQIPAEAVAGRYQGLELTDLAANRELLGGAIPPLAGHAHAIGVLMQRQRLLETPPTTVQLASARYLPAD